jgi:hypothetical protein
MRLFALQLRYEEDRDGSLLQMSAADLSVALTETLRTALTKRNTNKRNSSGTILA